MKPRRFFRPSLHTASWCFAATLSLLGSSQVAASTFTWDASGGDPLNDGAGTWSATGGSNWFDGTSTYGAWSNSLNDTAVFGVGSGAAGNVAVGTVNAGGITFNAAGSGNYTLTGGTITLGGTSILTANVDATIGSVISGSSGLTKTGTGTLTLSGNNNFTGGTTVSEGTLVFRPTGENWTIPSSKTVASGATLRFDLSQVPQTYSPPNYGRVTLGTTAVNGTVEIHSTATSGGNGAILITGNTVFTGAGAINKTGAGEADFWGPTGGTLTNFTGAINVNEGSLHFQMAESSYSGQSALTIALGAKVDIRTDVLKVDTLSGAGTVTASFNSNNTLLIGNNNGSSSFSGILQNGVGTLKVTKNGSGTQTLSGSNTYSGVTNINGGTLELSGGSGIGDSSAVSLANIPGVTLKLNASETIGSLAGGGSTGGTVNLQGNTLTAGGNNGTTTYSGTIAGTGGSLIKQGTGSLTLSGTNSNTGTTTVSRGILILNADAPTVLGNLTMNGPDLTHLRMQKVNQFGSGVVAAFTTNSGIWNRFDLMGKSQTLAGITTGSTGTQGGGVIQNRQNGNNTANSFGAATLMLDGPGDYLFHGILRDVDGGTVGTDQLNLVKSGTGTQTLLGSIIHTGTTTVDDGTLQIGAGTASGTLGSNSVTTVNSPGTLKFFRSDLSFAIASAISGAGSLVFQGTGNSLQSDYVPTGIGSGFTGTITIDKARLRADNSSSSFGNAASINVLNNSSLGLGFGGSGPTISTPISLAGAGWLEGSQHGALRLENGATVSGPVTLTANSTIGTINSSGGTVSGTVTNGGFGLTLKTDAGTLTLSNAIGGSGGLTKTGLAKAVLSGTNSYTGATLLNGGTLLVNGSTVSSSDFTVGTATTLGGTGSIGGTVNVSGVLSPGASIESLATGSLTMASGSTFAMEIQDTTGIGADLLDITGNFSLNGLVTLQLTKIGAATWTLDDKLTLASYTGTWNGGFFTYASDLLADGDTFTFDSQDWMIDYNDSLKGNNYASEAAGNYVTLTAIPEPAAALLGSLGMLFLLRRRR